MKTSSRTPNNSSIIVANPDRYARLGHQTFSILSGLVIAHITGLKLLSPRYMYFSEKWNSYIDWQKSTVVTKSLPNALDVIYLNKLPPDNYGNTK